MTVPLRNLSGNDIICALATPPGRGAIAVIRISGEGCVNLIDSIYLPMRKGDKLGDAPGYTIHHGHISDAGQVLDEVLVSIFRSPHSYTGEDVVEISTHGSVFVQKSIIELLIRSGARMADAGEFTLRAFLNGKYDLSQAEAVADLIASSSKAAHDLAISQMRGGFSHKIAELRQKLLEFSALMELELDFSEEEVEFADRKQFHALLAEIKNEISRLISSFTMGNVLKEGIPVAIIGPPNAGKSTLLNAILNEERAIVSEIPGTTRDTVEDVLVIQGIAFRFIDTAGLRHTADTIETLGIERTYEKIDQARVILYVFDINTTQIEDLREVIHEFASHIRNKRFMLIGNKTDLLVEAPHHFRDFVELETLFVSAKRGENISLILDSLAKSAELGQQSDDMLVSSTRHYEALEKSLISLDSVEMGLSEKRPTDLLAVDLKLALHHLGSITGEVTTEEVLESIFSKFCIGK